MQGDGRILELESAMTLFNQNLEELNFTDDAEKIRLYEGLVKLTEGIYELGIRLREYQKI